MLLLPHSFDVGVITIWAGSVLGVPPGWFLCDGTNGTPDLRDKFEISAGPSFSVGDEGGNVNHVHDFTPDAHTHSLPGVGTVASLFQPKTHGQLTSLGAADGTTDAGSSLPKYFALAYIQYLGS